MARSASSARSGGQDRLAGILVLLLALVLPAHAADNRAWLGIYSEPADTLPRIEAHAGGQAALQGALSGLLVTAVFPDSPADAGGLLLGDIIICLDTDPFTCSRDSVQAVFRRELAGRTAGAACSLRIIREAVARTLAIGGEEAPAHLASLFWNSPGDFTADRPCGETIDARVEKRQAVLDLPIVLGRRPEANWPAPRANEDILPTGDFPESQFAPLVRVLADEFGCLEDTEDLLGRLARCHTGSDPFRLEVMSFVHRDAFRLESVSRHIVESYSGGKTAQELVAASSRLLVPGFLPSGEGGIRRQANTAKLHGPQLKTAFLMEVEGILTEAAGFHALAFAGLTDEERGFLEAERWSLSDVFAGEVYIHLDQDSERFRRNKRLIDLAARVDYSALLQAAATLAELTDPSWAREWGDLLRAAFADSLGADILVNRETPYGRILVGGAGGRWYRETDAAFILDLGGDDFYTGNSGGSNGWGIPLAVLIDLEGDDAYESTMKSCQGAGCLGVGGLLDLAGDDQYIGIEWCQGTGYFGVGWLHDAAGDDTYRGRTFCQAAGLFGVGLLLDEEGGDRYEGDCHVQGVGLARGVGALVDLGGDDEYYAKGLYPTGYGDAGIFDAWSQGCGMGFRTIASGGLGLLSDGGGQDRMEAGNFSQGGGYYYGYGIVAADGHDDDTYIGSRYNQGFSAHQAVGVFLEEGGDDSYTTRQAVAQGLAWDECVSLFIDHEGDDVYEGGGGFSQGASAHNSFCFFIDRSGGDRYIYGPGQARAGGNDYHGGTSFSLFVDEGGRTNTYTSDEGAQGGFRYRPEHGFFLDLAGSLGEAMTTQPWRGGVGRPGPGPR